MAIENISVSSEKVIPEQESDALKEIAAILETENKNRLISYKDLDFFTSEILRDKFLALSKNSKRPPAKQVAFSESKEYRRQSLQIKRLSVEMDHQQGRWFPFDNEKGFLSVLIQSVNTDKVFELSNRKYLGSKTNLIPFIMQTILTIVGKDIETFFDPFAGTGVVAWQMQEYTDKVIANDILFSNYLGLKVFLTSIREKVNIGRLKNLITLLNNLEPEKGYVFLNFGGTYFTPENASMIDAIREEIVRLSVENKCTIEESEALLVSLLYAIDKCANTVGQYDAFLKHIGSKAMENGKHKVDTNVYKPVYLKRPFFFFNNRNEVYNVDAHELVHKIKAEVVYCDPPYNHRQYIDCYHLLENIMRWEKPGTIGKTKKFLRDHLKSDYSRISKASGAFSELVRGLQCKHIFLSYNSEGIIPDSVIIKVLKTRGNPEIFEKDYPVFGNGAGVSKRRCVKERLFYVKVVK